MLKKIRIETGGPDANKIAKGDRRVHTTTSGPDENNPGGRVADEVQWVAPGAGPNDRFIICFRYRAGSPLAPNHGPGNHHHIRVQPGQPAASAILPVSQGRDRYKYDVYCADANWNKVGDATDDPDVVID